VWENVVTSCAPCNLRKGNRLPEEMQMRMLVKPRVPTPALFVTLSAPRIPERWQPYLAAFA
jgi:5-methylcytosine-specific restriction endonuclease McrA